VASIETDDMQKKTNGVVQFISDNKMQVFLLSLSTIITVANIYIASLLTPLKEDIRRVEARLDEDKIEIKKIDERSSILGAINVRLESMDKRLDRIENKLDR
jgi:hypothetical protein